MTVTATRVRHATVTAGPRRWVKVRVDVEPDSLIVSSLRGVELARFDGTVETDGDGYRLDDVTVTTEPCGCGGTRVQVLIAGTWIEESRARRQGLLT